MSTLENPPAFGAAGSAAAPPSPVTAAVRAEFARLCDAAIAEAERQRAAAAAAAQGWRVENLDRLIRNLTGFKAHALAGTLPPSRGVAVLGLSRFASEWNEVDALADRLYPIDAFYQDHM